MSWQGDRAKVFFALDPPDALRLELGRLQARLDLRARAVRIVNLHITLAFLGEVARPRLAELGALAASLPFPGGVLELDVLGAFLRTRVAWLGPSRPPPALCAFQASLVNTLEQAGFPVDARPWKPHVTLYRNLRTACPRIPFEPLEWRVGAYCLMESVQHESGTVYRVLERWEAVP